MKMVCTDLGFGFFDEEMASSFAFGPPVEIALGDESFFHIFDVPKRFDCGSYI
jgi:hypothetical protein